MEWPLRRLGLLRGRCYRSLSYFIAQYGCHFAAFGSIKGIYLKKFLLQLFLERRSMLRPSEERRRCSLSFLVGSEIFLIGMMHTIILVQASVLHVL
jgi:hypothetical protein